LFVDFELSSIWHRAYSFADIDLDAPSVNAIVAQDGSLNLSQLKPKTPPAKRLRKNRRRRRGRCGDPHRFIQRQQGTGDVRGSQPAVRVHRAAGTDQLCVGQFHDRCRRRPIHLHGVLELGERVEWHGHLSVQPIESDRRVSIDGLHAHTIWEYLEDA